MDGLDELNICTGYRNAAGDKVSIPCDADDWAELVPDYETLPGWRESTVGVRDLSALPENARRYISRLEELSGSPIDIVSTGPDRVETIVLRHPFD